ncbi:MAG: NUDIX hydrolase [Patescibacteria group bacterium]
MKNNPREKEYKFCPSCTTKLSRKLIDKQKLLSCPKCGFVFWNNPKPVVSVILNKEGKILLIKRAQKPLIGYWCLPGGYVDYYEKPEEATIREVKEETNLNVKIKKLIGVYQIDNDPRGINLDIIYSGLITKGEIKLNEESQEFKFFTIDKLPRLIAYKHRQAIRDWKKIKK